MGERDTRPVIQQANNLILGLFVGKVDNRVFFIPTDFLTMPPSRGIVYPVFLLNFDNFEIVAKICSNNFRLVFVLVINTIIIRAIRSHHTK